MPNKGYHHPRGGSTLYRRSICFGSHYMEQGIPDRKTIDSAHGDNMHKAMEDDSEDGLNIHEIDQKEFCESVREEARHIFGEPLAIAESIEDYTARLAY